MLKLKDLLKEYVAIEATPKNLAKAAIRDIFIQMPTRTVHDMNWNGMLSQVIGVAGVPATKLAIAELKKEGWLSHSDNLWRWRKMFGPINPINKQPHFPSTYRE